SLMDSALQACVGLIADLNHVSSKPYVPFVLESLRIISPCAREMAAWIRYAEGSKPEHRAMKLDIDLCDHQGNICVQMRGFASRVMGNELRPAHETMRNSAPVTSNLRGNGSSFDNAFYQKLITDVVNHEVSIDEAVELAMGHSVNSN